MKRIDGALKGYEGGEEAEVPALRKTNLEMRISLYNITVTTKIHIRRIQESYSQTGTRPCNPTDSVDRWRVKVIQELRDAPLQTLKTDEKSHKPGKSSNLLN